MKPLIVDALASGKGSRLVTRDVIGAGQRTIAGIIESEGIETKIVTSDFFLNSTIDYSNFAGCFFKTFGKYGITFLTSGLVNYVYEGEG